MASKELKDEKESFVASSDNAAQENGNDYKLIDLMPSKIFKSLASDILL